MEGPRPKGRRAAPEAPTVVRRDPADRKRLPPELEAFANSDQRKFRPARPHTPRLKDPRAVALVPGVANRDARALCDARVEALDKLLARRGKGEDVDAAIAVALAEAVVLEVWRGRSLTGFDAFAENVLGMRLDDADRLAQEGRVALGLPEEPRSDELVAVWMRTEIALLESGLPGRVGCRVEDGRERVVIDLPLVGAPEAIQAVGRRMTPLVRDHEPGR